jgi:GR25 family glycosyltransferase involved in LPS biosynthesis|tara:strand:- start:262 stop:933 length:672 start_codon:yes stop_codon:yes gene_type:complete
MENITVNQFFDQVYLINLKRRPDKLKVCQQLFAKLNIKYKISEAIDFCDGIPEDYPVKPIEGSFLRDRAPGAWGCYVSHLEIIKDAKKNNYDKILILEDDVAIDDNFLSLFSQKVKDLPQDWKLFYLGASAHTGIPKKKVTDHISQTFESFTTSSYGIHSSIYDTILESEKVADKTIDLFLVKDIQSTHPCYVVTPTIMWQSAGFSDIQQKHLNYTGFMKNIS